MFAVDLESKNLRKLRALIYEACPQWYDLGMELRVETVTLDVIKSDNKNDTKACFREMLSEWLKMIDPCPSWKELIAALKQPCIGHRKLADKVREEQGIPEQSDETEETVSELHGNG